MILPCILGVHSFYPVDDLPSPLKRDLEFLIWRNNLFFSFSTTLSVHFVCSGSYGLAVYVFMLVVTRQIRPYLLMGFFFLFLLLIDSFVGAIVIYLHIFLDFHDSLHCAARDGGAVQYYSIR